MQNSSLHTVDTILCLSEAKLHAGKPSVFVEVRHEGLTEEQPGTWGFYTLSKIPQLVSWLDTGSQNEFELAENIYQAFQPQMWEAHEEDVVSGLKGHI